MLGTEDTREVCTRYSATSRAFRVREPCVSAGQAGLDERLHALRRIVAQQVDERGDLVGFQVLNGKRNEELTKLSLARRRVEPPIARSRR